jgi:ferric-dicitrate binding protein FerR (iron transport regulator)
MQTNYIKKIIALFLKDNFSEETRLLFIKWLKSDSHKYEKDESLKSIWDSIDQKPDWSTMEDLKNVRKKIKDRQKARTKFRIELIAAVLVIGLISTISTYYLVYNKIIDNQPGLTDIFVPNSELDKIILPDGTEVWLNSGTMLIYPKKFTGKDRVVYLNGEARFNVFKNQEHPFVVSTSRLKITALGTCFNVSSYPDDPNVIMTLERGKIKITSDNNCFVPQILSPDEQLLYTKNTKQIVRKQVDASDFSAWNQGHLVFQSASFEEIIKRLERHFDVSINFDSSRFKGKTFYVKFKNDETVEDAMEVMKELISGLKYIKKGRNIYII